MATLTIHFLTNRRMFSYGRSILLSGSTPASKRPSYYDKNNSGMCPVVAHPWYMGKGIEATMHVVL
jgi:hypothetical protein